MPALDAVLASRLKTLENQGLKRSPRAAARHASTVIMRNGRDLVSFSCNDYLGLSHHPEVIAASTEAAEQYGAGAGASRLVTGEHPLYAGLEAALADWKGTEAACVFGSGYLANLGAITALAEEGDLILGDKLMHACMIDGAKLSGATFKRFAHNDIAHLETLMKSQRAKHRHCLILTEAVFSMDGDCAPMMELQALAATYDCWLLVDGAHDLSCHPELVSAFLEKMPKQVRHDDIWIGTLSKALGAYGGYVCGSQSLIDYLKSTARSLIYTTALPPGVIAAANKALEILRADPQLAEKPLQNARYFTNALGQPEAQSAIVPIIIGDVNAAMEASTRLEEAGFAVNAIRPPTVPPGTARLRFAFSATHKKEDIKRMAAIVETVIPRLDRGTSCNDWRSRGQAAG